jgi:hypothetical protein
MNLDRRAAQAARSVRTSVAGVAPVAMGDIVGRQRRSLVISFAAAAAAVFLFVGLAAAMPTVIDTDQVATGTSIPDDAPIVVDPDSGDDTLVGLDGDGSETLAVHMSRSISDSREPSTVFYGAGEPGSVVVVTSEFAETSAVVGDDGRFEVKVQFDERPPAGVEFPILVTVDGRTYEFFFTSLYDPENIDISAHQTYGVGEGAEAFEKFFGTAPPGTEVVATSPYGSGDTVAGEHGWWDLKLWFVDLPFDEPFEITVAVGDETFEFGFVSTYQAPSLPLSISQVNTVSDSPSPFVQFVGTAPSGTHLLAQSEYGSHDIVVGESGEFSLKIWFSILPPAGEKFPITLKVNHEYYDTFHFTSLFEPGGDEVTVNQYNTGSDDPEPWVKFYGTAPTGTNIQIISPYGTWGWTTEAYEWNSGHRYFTTLPPAGEEFQITVQVNGETFGTYPFISWFDPETVEVSVTQHNDASDSPSPWVKFYGTAPTGTNIQIISPYGSWSWVTEAIEWNSGPRYFEPVPPAGETFAITVKVNGDLFDTYSFTSFWDTNQIIVEPVVTSSDGPEPYAKIEYYGPAGTSFQLTSPYGSSDTITLASNGSGHLKLFFASLPPAGEEFAVTVKVNGSTHSTFGFISWYEPA